MTETALDKLAGRIDDEMDKADKSKDHSRNLSGERFYEGRVTAFEDVLEMIEEVESE